MIRDNTSNLDIIDMLYSFDSNLNSVCFRNEKTVTTIMLIYLVLYNICTTLVISHQNVNIRLFTGVKTSERSDIIPYKTTIPLLFKSDVVLQINTSQIHKISECNLATETKQTLCKLQSKLEILHLKIDSQINRQLPIYNDLQKSKQRRALDFLGDFGGWCCNLAVRTQISDLYDNQKSIQNYTDQILDTVESEIKNVVNLTGTLNLFSDEIKALANRSRQNFNTLQKQISEVVPHSIDNILQTTYSLIEQESMYMLYNFYLDNINHVLRSCHKNQLSHRLILNSELASKLHELQGVLSKRNLTLAIPINKLAVYYKAKLVTCIVTNSSLIVKVDVPLRDKHVESKVLEIKPTPLVWEDKICKISKHKGYLIQTDSIFQAIMENDKNCNERTYPLCKLERIHIETEVDTLCLKALMNHANVNILAKHCEFTCVPRPKHPIIVKIDPYNYLITNFNTNLAISCKNRNVTQLIKPIKTGSLQILMPCTCKLVMENMILIDSVEPCDSYISDTPNVVQLLPNAWTNIKGIKVSQLSYHNIDLDFSNISEIIDHDWHYNFPTFHVKELKKVERVKLPHVFNKSVNDEMILIYILAAWCITLTLITLFLLYCVHILNIKANMRTPPVDYQK